ncbi:DNA/RNA non-specific endonuclease [Paenibacillus sp. P96]|uniref:DNA/RNA non-specific endonuclease n=1 Tax=Paenibacillus zeirhizosphaerae TaxID=2987519 RepID=A0ABT9FWR0_9BACL|nr:DNA/RNA non-specific endonuclease [Paenibacillus sp. P96]MDP4099135.1 DNA/RNA non-specific endonuclease [Paenibacillus sp. P96]
MPKPWPHPKSTYEGQQQAARKRYEARSEEREKAAIRMRSSNPVEAATADKIAVREAAIDPRDGLGLERVIGNNDLFPVSYLEAGMQAAKSVCRIEVRDHIGRVIGYGTGFLVSPSLLLTNNHVLPREEDTLYSAVQFNYELDMNFKERQMKSFNCAPKRLFLTDAELDFTLVAVDEEASDGTRLSDFGYLKLYSEPGKILEGEYVSIIQHPQGAPKMVAIRENRVTDMLEHFIHYSTDTRAGSSGAPVFNDQWMVAALHHAGVPDPNDSAAFIANEGVRISSILQAIERRRPGLNKEQRRLLDEVIHHLEVGQAAEAVEELDLEWYEGSTGYDPDFLGVNYKVPHPALRSDLEEDAAPLIAGGHILNYTHFSVVLSRSRQLALYTAVNIDGSQLKDVGRSDRWLFDPRMDRKYQCGPPVYEHPDIDRGHLVRRRDPVWGERAAEANEDTFHFTNAAPQHKKLNQQIWLGLEDYILQNTDEHNLKVSVFTGPVFREDDIEYRGVRIPAEFWKVAVMVKTDGKLSATAYLLSQKSFIDDLEFAFGEYKTYQVPVLQIEELTGLGFGELKQHDPLHGQEALVQRVVNGHTDIIL